MDRLYVHNILFNMVLTDWKNYVYSIIFTPRLDANIHLLVSPQDMAVISQTTFPNAFSWMKFFFPFWFEFHRSFFQGFNLLWINVGSCNSLATNRWQAIIWTNADPVHWRIFAARGVGLTDTGAPFILLFFFLFGGGWVFSLRMYDRNFPPSALHLSIINPNGSACYWYRVTNWVDRMFIWFTNDTIAPLRIR